MVAAARRRREAAGA